MTELDAFEWSRFWRRSLGDWLNYREEDWHAPLAWDNLQADNEGLARCVRMLGGLGASW